MAKRPLLKKLDRYFPHVLDGGQGKGTSGRRERIYRSREKGPLPWYQTWVMRNGHFEINMEEQKHRLSAPQIVIIPPRRECNLIVPAATEYHWIEWGIRHGALRQPRAGIRLHYKQYEWKKRLNAPVQPQPNEVWGIELPVLLPPELYIYSNRMIAQVASEWWRDSLGLALANAYLGQWLIHVVRYLKQPPNEHGESQPVPHWLDEAKRLLRQNLVNIITTQDWAMHLGLQEHQFRLRCLKETGSPPKQLMNGIRLEHAKTLLYTTEHPMTQIAALCGYHSRKSFTRWFKAQTGMTPSEWGEQHRRFTGTL